MLYWPIALSVAWPLALILVWSGPFGLSLFGTRQTNPKFSAATRRVIGKVSAARSRNQFRSTANSIASTSATDADSPQNTNNSGVGHQASEYVHFFVMRPIYLREISKLPADEPRLVVYNWGGLLLMDSHGVAYDESDEIALPERERSEAWKKRAHRTDAECVIGDTPVGNHFYLVGLDC